MSPRSKSNKNGCFPCSEAETIAAIRTDIGWIKKTMQDNKEDKIPERVTKLETHKKIVTWLITIFGPPITGGIGTIIYLIVKHMSKSGG